MREASGPFSPIKTRLNVRQTLLHSLEQQEREQIQYLKEQEKLKQQEVEIDSKANKLKTLRKIETSDEPIIKKSRKLKNLENQQDFQTANSKNNNSYSIQNGHDELNFSLNVVEKDTKPSSNHRLSLNLTSKSNHATPAMKHTNSSGNIEAKNQSTPPSSSSCNSNLNSQPTNTVTSNPISWHTNDVCKYLSENKFDPNLIYLIKEHVIVI